MLLVKARSPIAGLTTANCGKLVSFVHEVGGKVMAATWCEAAGQGLLAARALPCLTGPAGDEGVAYTRVAADQ